MKLSIYLLHLIIYHSFKAFVTIDGKSYVSKDTYDELYEKYKISDSLKNKALGLNIGLQEQNKKFKEEIVKLKKTISHSKIEEPQFSLFTEKDQVSMKSYMGTFAYYVTQKSGFLNLTMILFICFDFFETEMWTRQKISRSGPWVQGFS